MDYFVEGIVVDTNDPQQMGRVRVWCSSVDGEGIAQENLPWARYISPLAGQTTDFPAGSSATPTSGFMSYGFWAIPKVGSTVIIGFMYGDHNQRFYLGSYFPDHGNRSLPAGRNSANGPVSDIYTPVQPATANLTAQFQGQVDASEAKTRGAFERAVAQPKTDKDGTEGYQSGVVDTAYDPQTYCWVTPGRHAIIMQDNPETGRLRLKTAEGHQIIFDDANERIYVSTSKGKTWLEMDADGHVHLYGADSVSVSTGGDFNVSAKGSINMKAGGNINIGAAGAALISACANLELSGDGTTNLTGAGGLNIYSDGSIRQTGSDIHLNGPAASKAACAGDPSVVPNHEPWTRPAGSGRGKYWKP